MRAKEPTPLHSSPLPPSEARECRDEGRGPQAAAQAAVGHGQGVRAEPVDRRKPILIRRVLGAVAAGALLAAAFPPYNVVAVLPVGFALLVRQLDGVTVRQAAYTGFACGLVYFGGTLFWLGNLFGAAAVSLIAIA